MLAVTALKDDAKKLDETVAETLVEALAWQPSTVTREVNETPHRGVCGDARLHGHR